MGDVDKFWYPTKQYWHANILTSNQSVPQIYGSNCENLAPCRLADPGISLHGRIQSSKFTSILWLDIYSLPSKLLVTFNIYITTGMCLEKQISQVIWDEGNIFFELRTEVADRPSKLSEPRAIVHYYYCVGVLVC